MRWPPPLVRIVILGVTVRFCGLAHNPIIYLEAWLGLSPAPWERFTGLKTLFSGMSEAFYQLATGDVWSAFGANFLAPPLALTLVVATVLWQWPRLTRQRDEIVFFAAVVAASIAVNVVHGT